LSVKLGFSLLLVVFHISPKFVFRSKDEEIDLISEEEFYQDAPEEFTKPVSY